MKPQPCPPLREDQVLLRTLWLSLDPYMRGRMDDGDSYAPGLRLGQAMPAERGCRVVGIAGGEAKRRHVQDRLGFDIALDHRAPDFPDRLRQACPQGIDIYWENVGGAVFQAALPLLNRFARVPVCGLVAHYNDIGPPPGPDRTSLVMDTILAKRLLVQGFIVDDHWADHFDAFLRDMSAWVRQGQVTCREDVTEGLQNAPERFIGMLNGQNFGKTLIRCGA